MGIETKVHNCKRKDRQEDSENIRGIGYGPAIEYGPCWNNDKKIWEVGNSEYGSPVWFCPFCGDELT